MPKVVSYIMIGVGAVLGLITYFQNTINSRTLHSPFGKKTGSSIILYSIVFGVLIGAGLIGILFGKSKEDDDFDDEGF